MSLTSSQVFYVYGLFLMFGGVTAFAMAGFEPRAKTAIMMGGGCGLVMMLIGYLGTANRRVINVGRTLIVFFAALFSWRGYKIRDVSEKYYLFVCFCLLVTGTLLAGVGQIIAARSEAKSARNVATKKKGQD